MNRVSAFLFSGIIGFVGMSGVSLICSSYAFSDEDAFSNASCAAGTPSRFVGSYPSGLSPTPQQVEALQGSVGAISLTGSDSSSKVCTGILITPDYFLTAFHCLFINEPITSHFVTFNFQSKNGSPAPQAHFAIEKVISAGAMPTSRTAFDYAILKLSGSPGKRFGFTPIHIREPLLFGEMIFTIHHPGGLPKAVNSGNILNPSAAAAFPGLNEFKYFTSSNLSAAPGSSGGPVFDLSGRLIGLNTFGNCSKQFFFNSPLFPLSMQNSFLKLSSLIDIDPILKQLATQGFDPDNAIFRQ